MKFIFQIAAGIILGGAVLMAATGLLAEHLGLRLARDVVAAVDRSTELQKAQLAFYQEQLEYLEVQQARISTEIQMARIELRERLAAQPTPTRQAPAAVEQTAPPEERQMIARGGNAGDAMASISSSASDPAGPEEAKRKEDAWARFYEKPDGCEFIVDQATMVRCGNDHIVKRREFEQLWDQGMIE